MHYLSVVAHAHLCELTLSNRAGVADYSALKAGDDSGDEASRGDSGSAVDGGHAGDISVGVGEVAAGRFGTLEDARAFLR
eukprot:SAG11_NODE_12789_length_685_cov_1.102389_1_plen_79_part_10